jgi:hypothetical protein
VHPHFGDLARLPGDDDIVTRFEGVELGDLPRAVEILRPFRDLEGLCNVPPFRAFIVTKTD